MKEVSINTLKTRRDAKVKQLSEAGPSIQGSLYKRSIKCGSPTCKCARGERHEAYVISSKVRGKTKCIHVPRELVEEAESWTKEYKRIKKLLKEISDLNEQIIRLHVKASRAANKNKEHLNRSQPT